LIGLVNCVILGGGGGGKAIGGLHNVC